MQSRTPNPRAGRGRQTVGKIFAAASAIAAALVAPAKATLLYESAELGPIGQVTGSGIDSNTFLGVRFQVFAPITADRVGGHLGTSSLPSTTLFGALVQLSGPGDFPDTQNLTSADVLRTTVLTVPYGSNEVIETFTPISLSAGWYGLVLGSGKFGATGSGLAALNNDDYGSPSFFFRSGNVNWSNTGQTGMRFVVAGPSPKFWANAVNGNWHDSSKWYTASVPQSYDDVTFDQFATYTINFTQNGTVHDLSNQFSNVTLALGGHTLATTGQVIVGSDVIGGAVLNVQNGILSTPGHNISIGESGVASMTVSNSAFLDGYAATTVFVGKNKPGTLTVTSNGQIYSAQGRVADTQPNGSGTVTLSGGGAWHVRDSFDVGHSGAGVVNINGGGTLDVGSLLSIWDTAGTEVRLQGGWLKTASMWTSNNPSRFVWTSGTLQTTSEFPVTQFGPLGGSPSIGPGRTFLCDGGVKVYADAQLNVDGGTVTGPATNSGTINQTGGLMQVTGSSGLEGSGSVTVTGGTLAARRIKQQSITIGGTGVVKLDVSGATGPSTSRIGILNITGSGKMDLTNKKLIVPGAGTGIGFWNGSHYTGVTGLIQSGRGDGSWNGSGIMTSMTDATTGALTTVAVATGAEVFGPGGSNLWGGEWVSGNSVLVMYTWGGDADLNGVLDGEDYFYIDSNILTQIPGYHNGDFDYNGHIDGEDYFIIDSNILYAQASGISFASSAGGSSFERGAGAWRFGSVVHSAGGAFASPQALGMSGMM